MAVACIHFFTNYKNYVLTMTFYNSFSFFFLINGILRHSDNILIKVTAHSEKLE